jgi:zona occludens toxin
VIYLRTGANGAGKTLLTLRDVHAKALKESRPVYHNGRFAPVAGGPLDSWKVIDAKDWESVPDGAIFVFDECHNDFPVRGGSSQPPGYIKALAEHRRRGFDFFLITQHPLNIDSFVRRLIGAPGWHQHLKRASGAPLVSVIEWPAVNEQCQKAGAGESGQVNMVPYTKEVYKWYTSTSLDTAKLKIPFRVWVVVACVVLVPVAIWLAVSTFTGASEKREAQLKKLAGPDAGGAVAAGRAGGAAAAGPLSAAEYVATYHARLPGLAFTAPRYDKLTEPTDAPFPAACIASASRCECYSQQATPLHVADDLCRQIVKAGYFKDWGGARSDMRQPERAPAAAPAAAPSVALPAPEPATPAHDGKILGMMRTGERLPAL